MKKRNLGISIITFIILLGGIAACMLYVPIQHNMQHTPHAHDESKLYRNCMGAQITMRS